MSSTGNQFSAADKQFQGTEQQTNNAGEHHNQSQGQDQPGLIGGHAQYLKGSAVESVGNLTGNREWQASGQREKEEARNQMRQAGQNRDPAQQGFGRAEEIAGRTIGCEGMEQEGQQSRKQ